MKNEPSDMAVGFWWGLPCIAVLVSPVFIIPAIRPHGPPADSHLNQHLFVGTLLSLWSAACVSIRQAVVRHEPSVLCFLVTSASQRAVARGVSVNVSMLYFG